MSRLISLEVISTGDERMRDEGPAEADVEGSGMMEEARAEGGKGGGLEG